MSLTLGTLLILFFLLSGLVFRKAFFVLPFDKRYAEGNTLSEISIILITAVFIQWLGIILVEWIYPTWYGECQHIYDFFHEYLFSKPTDLSCKLKFDRINFGRFVSYQFCLWILAAFLGFLFNSLVRYFKWDRKYRFLRFGNSWYYYFSGEALEFPDIGGDARDIDYIFVDALVRAEGKEIIYIGILSEYELSSNGGLKSFALKGAKRRCLGTDSERMMHKDKLARSEEDILQEYYTIPSNLLVIPYNDNIININFRYYTDDEDDSGESDNNSSLEKIVQYISLAILVILLVTLLGYITNSIFQKNKKKSSDQDKASK